MVWTNSCVIFVFSISISVVLSFMIEVRDAPGNLTSFEIGDGCLQLPQKWQKQIHSLSMQSGKFYGCVILYSGRNCTEKKLKANRKPIGNLGEHCFDEEVMSIESCKDCSEENLKHREKNVSLIVYNNSDYNETIKVSGCTRLPEKDNIQFESGSCIDLHETDDCTNINETKTEYNQVLERSECKVISRGNRKSASPCSYHCGPSKHQDNKTIVLFRQKDKEGNYAQIVVDGCTKLNVENKGLDYIRSVNMYNSCFKLFNNDECSGENISVDEKGNLADDKPRSVASCDYKQPAVTETQTDLADNTLLITIGSVLGGLVLISIIAAAIYYKKRRVHKLNKSISFERLTSHDIEEWMLGIVNCTDIESFYVKAGVDYSFYTKAYDSSFEIPRKSFTIDPHVLGIGHYGRVNKGTLMQNECSREIAIKTAPPNSDVNTMKSLLREIKIMIHAGSHPRIVEFIGCCTENLNKHELYIIMGICENGSLDNYLRSHKSTFCNLVVSGDMKPINDGYNTWKQLNTHDLLRFSYEISDGMLYLESRNIVHADLSLRNLLVDSQLNIRITDFGLSSQLYQYVVSTKKHDVMVPFKWMALKSLERMEFSTKSDVYSFGVTLWELFTNGNIPFGGINWSSGFIDLLRNGMKLDKPLYAPSFIYNEIMVHCWQQDPNLRPSFSTIRSQIETFCNSHEVKLNLQCKL